MVEKVSGERPEKYLHEHIFGPLGMADTKPIEFENAAKAGIFHGRRPLLDGSDCLKCTGTAGGPSTVC
jgi:CubicO group peptidase (beta-lactamase class C family)